MAMATSPKRFRAGFRELLLELHWRHWCALGITGQAEPEHRWIVDLEALAVSTLAFGQEDARLSRLAHEWLVMNREWVSTTRLRRIGRAFGNGLVPTGSGSLVVTHKRSKVAPPVVTQPVLLQLQLRALLGMDVRADAFWYLLFNTAGNSSSIARALHVDQRRVYDVLERWCGAGVVRKVTGGYSLVPDAIPAAVAEARNQTEWQNWTTTLLALARLNRLLTKVTTDDRYIVSSLARDVRADIEPQAAAVGVSMSPDDRYPGDAYFEPFAVGVTAWLERLVGRRG